MANDFNEKVCIDLKHWENGFIFYDKTCSLDILQQNSSLEALVVKQWIMKHWVSISESLSTILNDNGGKFTGDEYEVKELKKAQWISQLWLRCCGKLVYVNAIIIVL